MRTLFFFFCKVQVVSVKLVRIPKLNTLNALLMTWSCRLVLNSTEIIASFMLILCISRPKRAFTTWSQGCCRLELWVLKGYQPSKSWAAGCLPLDVLFFHQPELEAPSLVPLNSVLTLYHMYTPPSVPLLSFFVPTSQHSPRPTLAFVLVFYCFIRSCHKKHSG